MFWVSIKNIVMSGISLLSIIFIYFSVLLLVSWLAGRRGSDNDAFFLGNKKSPWWVVAIGMIGSTISGVSFVSVPGMVRKADFSYMQMVVGFFIGYLIIARVLLPLYYRMNVTSIYTYLRERFGMRSYKTGAWFFLLSRTIASGIRLYLVTLILQHLIFDQWGVPFAVTSIGAVFLIWLYTHRSGIKTIVWTDTLQTFCLIAALVLILINVIQAIEFGTTGWLHTLCHYEHAQIFVFDDWHTKQNFFKQFISGIFVAIVMTGLDQDMMQKNLTCKSLKEAQRNMYWYGFAFVPLNLIFLSLGAMLLILASQKGIVLPASGDDILPLFATQYLGEGVTFLFVIGIIAATFASSDSALASLTTSFSVDILEVQKMSREESERKRKWVHAAMSVVFVLIMLAFQALNNKSIIDAVYTIVSYTYGPLLGMFAFGLLTRRPVNDSAVPFIAVVSPLLSYGLSCLSVGLWNYTFGYELLIINGMITFAGMWLVPGRTSAQNGSSFAH